MVAQLANTVKPMKLPPLPITAREALSTLKQLSGIAPVKAVDAAKDLQLSSGNPVNSLAMLAQLKAESGVVLARVVNATPILINSPAVTPELSQSLPVTASAVPHTAGELLTILKQLPQLLFTQDGLEALINGEQTVGDSTNSPSKLPTQLTGISNVVSDKSQANNASRWLVQVVLVGNDGSEHKLTALSIRPLPANTPLAIRAELSASPPELLIDRQLSQIEAINQGLRVVANEGRPLTDLANLHQSIARNSLAERIFSKPALVTLKQLAEFGIGSNENNNNLDIKQLITKIGVFSQATPNSDPTVKEFKPVVPSETGSQLQKPSELRPDDKAPAHAPASTTSGEKAISAAATRVKAIQDSDTTLKAQLVELILKLISQPVTPGPSAAIAEADIQDDAILALMQHLVKNNLAQPFHSNGTNKPDAQFVKAQILQVLKQVLLGIQGTQLKHLAEHNKLVEHDTQQVNLLNLELPIHWSHSTSKAVFKVSHRQSTKDEENSGNGGKAIRLWQFELTMDLPGDRIMTTRCSLDEQSVRIQFWANQEDFRQEIEHRTKALKTRMEADGIQLDYCGCALGLAPDSEHMPLLQRLINTRA